MRKLATLGLIMCLAPTAEAQVRTFITAKSCNYAGGIAPASVYAFKSSRDARDAIDRIMEYTGLEPNFEIHAASIPNAAALVDSGPQGLRRVILYNERFIDAMTAASGSEWASLSILAHEIGHHLNGHTLEAGGSRPPTELAADRFAGFVLGKMGASREEAQSAIARLADVQGSSTHPPRAARLDAVYNGWRAADVALAGGERAERSERAEPAPVPEPVPEVNARTIPSVGGTWENGMARLVVTQSGNQLSVVEYMFGFLPTAQGAGTIVNGLVTLQVQLTTGEILNVQMKLSNDGQQMQGFVVNVLGGRNPLGYRRAQ